MNTRVWLLGLLGLWAASLATAQVPVTPHADHQTLLASKDPLLAQNKRIVYDWIREVFEAGHVELAPKYMAEDYIQHNPKYPTGRQAFVEHFSKMRQPAPIQPDVKAPLVAILAEGDLVTTAIAVELPEPEDPTKKYTTTWFDMFRIANGKIVEHWDGAMKRGMPPAPLNDTRSSKP